MVKPAFFSLGPEHICTAAIIKRALTQFFSWIFIPIFGISLVTSLLFMSLGLAQISSLLLVMIGFLGMIFFGCVLFQWVYFLKFYVVLTADSLVISRGWLLHRTLEIPIDAIQDIILEEDSFDRWQQLATVYILPVPHVIIPIGTIDGFTVQQAATLRDQLQALKTNRPILGELVGQESLMMS